MYDGSTSLDRMRLKPGECGVLLSVGRGVGEEHATYSDGRPCTYMSFHYRPLRIVVAWVVAWIEQKVGTQFPAPPHTLS